jgi:hypothetical protein
MTVDPDLVAAAIAATGLSHEDVARELGRDQIDDQEFIEALRNFGCDIQRFEADAEEWRKCRAQARWLLDQLIDAKHVRSMVGFEIDTLIRETLNASNIYAFIELVAADTKAATVAVAASRRHAQNHAMRDIVHEWCNANMARYRSMDNAAEAVAGKVVHVAHTTARAWIKSWPGLQAWRVQKSKKVQSPRRV